MFMHITAEYQKGGRIPVLCVLLWPPLVLHAIEAKS